MVWFVVQQIKLARFILGQIFYLQQPKNYFDLLIRFLKVNLDKKYENDHNH
jgi:hypothetical protein